MRDDMRWTPQRRAVLDALIASHDHPTAAELHARAQDRYPRISMATVYNALHYLRENGLVHELPTGSDPSRYDAVTEPHAHIRCRRCGALADLPGAGVRAPRAPAGWRTDDVQLTVVGLCPGCSEPAAAGPAH